MWPCEAVVTPGLLGTEMPADDRETVTMQHVNFAEIKMVTSQAIDGVAVAPCWRAGTNPRGRRVLRKQIRRTQPFAL